MSLFEKHEGRVVNMTNILSICRSSVKESNTELILRNVLKSIKQNEIKIDIFNIQGKIK